MKLMTYENVLTSIGDRRRHLLLGNGFSIALDGRHAYGSLYEKARGMLSENAKKLFDYLGTNDFEGVLRLLDDAAWVTNDVYALCHDGIEPLTRDRDSIREALVDALANLHFKDSSAVPEEKKESAARFLSGYKQVFTLNYDLLLYWAIMTMPERNRLCDGFHRPEGDLIFDVNTMRAKGPCVWYLHGALHLYVEEDGTLRKHAWMDDGTKLTELIREGLVAKRYPLFVAEGTATKKKRQIASNPYLAQAFAKLGRIENALVVYGASFSPSDRHVLDAIVASKVTDLYASLYGDPKSASNRATRTVLEALASERPSNRPLQVHYYDAASAPVWTLNSA